MLLKQPKDFKDSDGLLFKRGGFRPGLKGDVINKASKVSRDDMKRLDKRKGIQNIRIVRPAFRRSDYKGRTVDFTMPGPTFDLGEKTLEKMFNVQENDETDKEYMEKYKEIKEANPNYTDEQIESLIGRPQRVVTKQINIAQASKNIASEINAMKQAIRQGMDDNTKKMIELKTFNVLASEKNLSVPEQIELSDIINKTTASTQTENKYIKTYRTDTLKELGLPKTIQGDKNMSPLTKGHIQFYVLKFSNETLKQNGTLNFVKNSSERYKLGGLITALKNPNNTFDLYNLKKITGNNQLPQQEEGENKDEGIQEGDENKDEGIQ